jgi:hypothetical protein
MTVRTIGNAVAIPPPPAEPRPDFLSRAEAVDAGKDLKSKYRTHSMPSGALPSSRVILSAFSRIPTETASPN